MSYDLINNANYTINTTFPSVGVPRSRARVVHREMRSGGDLRKLSSTMTLHASASNWKKQFRTRGWTTCPTTNSASKQSDCPLSRCTTGRASTIVDPHPRCASSKLVSNLESIKIARHCMLDPYAILRIVLYTRHLRNDSTPAH